MRRFLFAALVLAACSRAPKTAAGPLDYASPDGRFTARVPAAWRVDETRGEARLAEFFGPGTGTESELIAVYFYASDSRWKTPLDFALAQGFGARARPLKHTDAAGRSALDVTVEREMEDEHLGRRTLRVRSLLVPADGGFFALQDFTDPARAGGGAEFDAFAASFRPGPAPK